MAVRKAARAGVEPSVTYGVTVTGCATMEVDTLRTESFKAVAPSVAGWSRALTLIADAHARPDDRSHAPAHH
eukprot:9480589-Pyramimonas_sp.AAC.1